jgi:hypothetical protein
VLSVAELDRVLQAADPAADLSFEPDSDRARRAIRAAISAPSTASSGRRQRRRIALVPAAAAVVVAAAFALSAGDQADIVARAAAATDDGGVLHVVSEWRRGGELAGRGELWFVPGDDPRSRFVNQAPDGKPYGETVIGPRAVSGWTAATNTINHASPSDTWRSSVEEALEALAAARSGDQRYSLLEDTTIRGQAVHVVRFQPAGEPTVRYYLDQKRYLPVRIERQDSVIDIVEIDRLPLDDAAAETLRMSAHPGAREVELKLAE